ncbi:MAG: hypothetical protein K2Y37_13445 [Pirellulales bacterium]|nr:hypothetical protein [Pirellulales bacterium]
MAPKLTPEMREALARHPGQPVEIEDDETKRVYLLFDREQARELLDDWIVRELAIAEADVAAGRTVEWDADNLLRDAYASR